MLVVVSPAKSLDFESKAPTRKHSIPAFLPDSSKLIATLRGYSPGEISDLMGISAKLGELNCDRYAQWSTPFDRSNAKQAVLAFKGDVYMGMQAWDYSERDFTWAQKHVRILSGLYGILKPLDLIQPYRLEMGIKLPTSRGKNLYEFWGKRLTRALACEIEAHRGKMLVNLASNEYFEAIDESELGARVVTPTFRDLNNGRYKFVSFYAKKARGLMASYIVKNRIQTFKGLKGFDWNGYRYADDLSRGDELVFLRDKPE